MVDTHLKIMLITPIKTVTTYVMLTTDNYITDNELSRFTNRCLKSALMGAKAALLMNRAEKLGQIDLEELDNKSYATYQRLTDEQVKELVAQGVEWIKG